MAARRESCWGGRRGAMAGSGKKRLPYRITLGGLLAVTMAVNIAFCLFWYGADSIKAPVMGAIAMEAPESMDRSGSWWAIFAGASFLGGALGAAIGQVFRDER